MIRLMLIAAAGSFVGGAARFLLNRFLPALTPGHFPMATFLANIAGCFIIGLVYGCASRHFSLSPELKLFLTVGFCGGLTTFSTFINESLLMMNSRHIAMFILYITASIATGLLAAWLGNQCKL